MLESMGSQRVNLPVYPYSGIEINRKKKRVKYMYCGMDEQQNHYAQLKKKKPDTTYNMLCDSIYMK